jgi:hypothetical protein
MPDTGAPWNIPYVESADLVSDWPADSLLVANAVAAGLSAVGGLVAVKHALFTGTQTNSTAAGANFAVTDLSITHTLADAANKLIISAYFGTAGTSNQAGDVGLAVDDGGTFIGVGAADGSRTRLGAQFWVNAAGINAVRTNPSVTFVYAPGDALAHTYEVYAINTDTSTRTLYINRAEGDANSAFWVRAASGLVIQEVKV